MFRVVVYDNVLGRQVRYYTGTDILSVLTFCINVEHLNVTKIEEEVYEQSDES